MRFPKQSVLLPQQGNDLIILLTQFRQDGHDEFGRRVFGKARHHVLQATGNPTLRRGANAFPRLFPQAQPWPVQE